MPGVLGLVSVLSPVQGILGPMVGAARGRAPSWRSWQICEVWWSFFPFELYTVHLRV